MLSVGCVCWGFLLATGAVSLLATGAVSLLANGAVSLLATGAVSLLALVEFIHHT